MEPIIPLLFLHMHAYLVVWHIDGHDNDDHGALELNHRDDD